MNWNVYCSYPLLTHYHYMWVCGEEGKVKITCLFSSKTTSVKTSDQAGTVRNCTQRPEFKDVHLSWNTFLIWFPEYQIFPVFLLSLAIPPFHSLVSSTAPARLMLVCSRAQSSLLSTYILSTFSSSPYLAIPSIFIAWSSPLNARLLCIFPFLLNISIWMSKRRLKLACLNLSS